MRDENHPSIRSLTARALRLSVRTPDFHSGKRGSTPLGRATLFDHSLSASRTRRALNPGGGVQHLAMEFLLFFLRNPKFKLAAKRGADYKGATPRTRPSSIG
ncbi:protein of unknown function [Pseudorhizobium banfieldiae]|uniref:Uncharacterized protein n=1 Tax=Pseudorhizobium banfieldiae TaxID=1125847 RepID=L0NFZ6_9HYPH|nr:protein of unknown function [Pseudorhizobium banfieldiae]